MTIETAYDKFLEYVNKNAINDEIAADEYRFILHFRSAELSLLEEYLERRNEDDIRAIQRFLKPEKLQVGTTSTAFTSYKLPTDFFDFSNVSITASKGSCKDTLYTFEVKNEDVEEYLRDDHNNPSFEARETFYTIFNDSINVYKDDFKIERVDLFYYRYPRQPDIQGYELEEGKVSTNVDPEWDDKMVERIIKLAAGNFLLANDDPKQSALKQESII